MTDVDPAAPIVLRLSEPVSGVSAASLSLHDADGVAVPTTATYDVATQVATLQPATPLALSSHYAVVAGDEIRDAAGQSLALKTWSFSTALDADPLSSDALRGAGEGPA